MNMRTTRRAMLALIATAGLGIAGSSFLRNLWQDRRLRDTFADLFGSETVQLSPAQEFLRDYLVAVRAGQRRPDATEMAAAFLSSSSFLVHHETGAPLEYGGLFTPYDLPCGNRLSAMWAPEDRHAL